MGQREHCQQLFQLCHTQSCRSAPGDPAQLFICLFFLGISRCHVLRMWISDFVTAFLAVSLPLCHISVIEALVCLFSIQCLGTEQVLPLPPPFLFSSPFGSFVLPSPLLSFFSFSALSSSPSPSLLPYQPSSSQCPFYPPWVPAPHLPPFPAHPCSGKAWGCAGGEGRCCNSRAHPLSSFPRCWQLVHALLSLIAGDVCLTLMNLQTLSRRQLPPLPVT